MNAFLAEPVIGRQFDFDSDDLPHGRDRKIFIHAAPRNEKAASTDVLRIHIALHPQRRRRDMASELDLDPRTLTSINVSHFFWFDIAEFSSVREAHQCRNWVITFCCRRIAGEKATSAICAPPNLRRRMGHPGVNRGRLQIFPRKVISRYYPGIL